MSELRRRLMLAVDVVRCIHSVAYTHAMVDGWNAVPRDPAVSLTPDSTTTTQLDSFHRIPSSQVNQHARPCSHRVFSDAAAPWPRQLSDAVMLLLLLLLLQRSELIAHTDRDLTAMG